MPKSAKRTVQPEDIYLLLSVSDPQLSPDGKHIAYTVAWNDRESDKAQSAVWVAPVEGRQRARRFTQGIRNHSPSASGGPISDTISGGPGGIRTHDSRIKSPELLGRVILSQPSA